MKLLKTKEIYNLSKISTRLKKKYNITRYRLITHNTVHLYYNIK